MKAPRRWQLLSALLGAVAALAVARAAWWLRRPAPTRVAPPAPGPPPERLVVALTLPPFCRDGWCWESPRPQGHDLVGLWGAAADDVWAVGGDCDGVSAELGWTGDSATLLHWDGKRWAALPTDSSAALCGVWGTAASDVWAVGAQPVALHFDGRLWARVPLGVDAAFLRGIGGRSSTEVWAVGDAADGSDVLRWDGQRWSPLDAQAGEPLAEVAPLPGGQLLATAASSGALFLFGKRGARRADDAAFGAASATALGAADPGGDVLLASSHFVRGTREGPWAVQWDADTVENPFVALRAFEAGRLRPLAEIEAPEKPAALWRAADDDAWMAGEGGLLLHWDGRALARTPAPTQQDLLALWGSSPSSAWAAGRGGALLRWNGKAWAAWSQTLAEADLVGLAGTDRELWVVGRGTLLEYDGQRWWHHLAAERDDLRAVWASPDGQVWAVGDGVTLRWDGGKLQRVPGPRLDDVWGSSDGDVWAVGRRRTGDPADGVFRWGPTGWRWIDVPPGPPERRLHRISGSGAADVWVAGRVGSGDDAASYALHWDGKAWSVVRGEGVGQADELLTLGPRDVWACGDRGLAHWDGERWTPQPLDAPSPFQLPEAGERCRRITGRAPDDVDVLSQNLAARRWRWHHWDGKVWTSRPLPVPQGGVAAFTQALGRLWIAGARGSLLRQQR
ncbi:MAG TPA: hypothetical protein VMB50_00360 [Myxococcales bacterium]|nr:hypothetical protein [Myxococcales bacterium]